MSKVARVPTLADVEVRFRRGSGEDVVCGLGRLPVEDVLVGRPAPSGTSHNEDETLTQPYQ
jgi:hypothetical protein